MFLFYRVTDTAASRRCSLAAVLLCVFGFIWSGAERAAAAPGNDHFADAYVFTGMLVSTNGSNVGATPEPDEPDHAGKVGGHSVWWTWTATTNGLVTMDTIGSSFDTLLAVYTGDTVTNLDEVASDDDGGPGQQSLLAFSPVPGTTYHIAVDGYHGAIGSIVLNLQVVNQPNDRFQDAIAVAGTSNSVSGSNVGATTETDEPLHAGKNGGHSVWWTWTAPASGQVVMDTLGSSFDTLLAVYVGNSLPPVSCVASNDDINLDADILTSRVSFPAVSGTGYNIAVDGYAAASGDILLNLRLTSDSLPFAHTQTPQAITETSATLHGMATPNGSPATAWFEWGTNTSYDQATPPVDIGSGAGVVHVSSVAFPLQQGVLYHCRLVVSNATGTAFGADQRFIAGGNIALWGGSSYYHQAEVPDGLNNVTAIAAGNYHTLALNRDGAVTAWRFNFYGQTNVPAGLADVVDIASGGYHSLALRNNGTVVAWGDGFYGATNVPAGLNGVVAISGGGRHNLTLRNNGSVVAWGNGFYGETNVPAGLGNVVAVAAGSSHSLALRDDGRVVAWGTGTNNTGAFPQYGQAQVPEGLSGVVAIAAGGFHSLALRADGTVTAWGWNLAGQTNVPAGLTEVVAIAAGASHSLALRSDGEVVVWGADDHGQKTQIPFGGGDVAAISGGVEHSVALVGANLRPRTTALNVSGQSGRDLVIALSGQDFYAAPLSFRVRALPLAGALYQYTNGGRGPVVVLNDLVSDSFGRVVFVPAPGALGTPHASFAFTASNGQLDSKPATVTVNILPPGNAFAATQVPHSISTNQATLNGMATPNGSPAEAWFEWGPDASGGRFTSHTSIGAGSNVMHVSARVSGLTAGRIYHSRLVVSNAMGITLGPDQMFVTGGTVSASGLNDAGQINFFYNMTNVVAVGGGYLENAILRTDGTVGGFGNFAYGKTNLPGVATIAGGYEYASGYKPSRCLALKTDGTVWRATISYELLFSQIPELSNVVAIAGGGNSLALRSDGTVAVIGNNTYGQTNVPVGLSSVVAIAGGESHCLALRHDGKVVAWGRGDFGQTNIPAGLSNVIAIAGGGLHSLALRSDGGVVAWGNNDFGQTNVPPGLSNVIAIAAGYDFSLALRSDGLMEVWGNQRSGAYQIAHIGWLKAATFAAGFAHNIVVGIPMIPDSFASRLPLPETNVAQQVFNVGATQEAFEQASSHSFFQSDKSIWYSWHAPSAGGAKITADCLYYGCYNCLGSFNFFSPVLAVYTGDTPGALTKIADNTSGFGLARVVFNAVAGTTYQIVVDGTAFQNEYGDVSKGAGPAILKIELTPPPANDLFANRQSIGEDFYETSGSFIGATREANELPHGSGNYPQTLWWTWTAPTNSPSTRVRLLADSVSLPPDIGVYRGNALGSLTNVLPLSVTNGMTRVVDFTANVGETFQIALAGRQHDQQGRNIISDLYGNYRFRLFNRLIVLNVVSNSTFLAPYNGPCGEPTNSTGFTASAVVSHSGTAATRLLRVRLEAQSGFSVKGPDAVTASATCDLGTFPVSPTILAPNQSAFVLLNGIVPPPTDTALGRGVAGTGAGWGVYATLEEQTGADWLALDQTPVLFGNWPTLGEPDPGPGGGVIRLDPRVEASSYYRLDNLAVLGPASVPEGGVANFFGRATYVGAAGSRLYDFTNTAWFATPSNRFTITTNGLFASGSVTSNTMVVVAAPYTNAGRLKFSATNVTVMNQDPTLAGVKLQPNGSLAFTLSGVPGRGHVIEAATNLTPPAVWLPLATNIAAANGLTNFTDSARTNFSRRFYRVREF